MALEKPSLAGILKEIAGVPVERIVREFGTPVFVYDRNIIEKRVAELRGFPRIRYAQKANSNLAVLSLLRSLDVVVDAVSSGEIYRALRAGYAPEDIVYTADVFDRSALEMVAAHGIRVNCGSMDMIDQYAAVCPGRAITLRINPGFGHGHSQKTNTGGKQSKHGIWHEQLRQSLERAEKAGVPVTGLHMHIGSGADFEHLSQVCGAISKAAEAVGPQLEILSAGGGLPTPYRENDQRLDVGRFVKAWMSAFAAVEAKLNRKLTLEVEPGRYLVAECGFLITEIRAVKTQADNEFYLLNAGFNNLARPILYGAYHPMSICRANGSTDSSERAVVVAGPLCESGDIFTQAEGGFVEKRMLPSAHVGDWLVIGCAGAYSFAMSSNYNSYPLAAEVMISRGKPILIRERQSLEDLVRGEHIPESWN